MSSTDSGVTQKVDGMLRIHWSTCSGFTGRLRPDYALFDSLGISLGMLGHREIVYRWQWIAWARAEKQEGTHLERVRVKLHPDHAPGWFFRQILMYFLARGFRRAGRTLQLYVTGDPIRLQDDVVPGAVQLRFGDLQTGLVVKPGVFQQLSNEEVLD